MDSTRLKVAFQRLEALDERLSYKINPRTTFSAVSPTADQVDAKLRDVARYTLELKDIMREFMLAFARPRKSGGKSRG